MDSGFGIPIRDSSSSNIRVGDLVTRINGMDVTESIGNPIPFQDSLQGIKKRLNVMTGADCGADAWSCSSVSVCTTANTRNTKETTRNTKKTTALLALHKHPLVKMDSSTFQNHRCNKCRSKGNSVVHRCEKCDYDLCETCYTETTAETTHDNPKLSRIHGRDVMVWYKGQELPRGFCGILHFEVKVEDSHAVSEFYIGFGGNRLAFLHENINTATATQLLEQLGNVDGNFLIRGPPLKRMLSVTYNREATHYLIAVDGDGSGNLIINGTTFDVTH